MAHTPGWRGEVTLSYSSSFQGFGQCGCKCFTQKDMLWPSPSCRGKAFKNCFLNIMTKPDRGPLLLCFFLSSMLAKRFPVWRNAVVYVWNFQSWVCIAGGWTRFPNVDSVRDFPCLQAVTLPFGKHTKTPCIMTKGATHLLEPSSPGESWSKFQWFIAEKAGLSIDQIGSEYRRLFTRVKRGYGGKCRIMDRGLSPLWIIYCVIYRCVCSVGDTVDERILKLEDASARHVEGLWPERLYARMPVSS